MMTSDDHAQSVVITVNEAFSPLAAITELNKLDLKAKNAIHCNFTFLPAMVCTICIHFVSSPLCWV